MSIIRIGTAGYTGGTIAAGDTVVGTGTVSSVQNNGSLILTNTGTLATATGGSVEVTGSLSGTGISEIGGGGTLQVDGPITQGTISFGPGAAETLIINELTSFAGTINGIRDGGTSRWKRVASAQPTPCSSPLNRALRTLLRSGCFPARG